MLGRFFGRLTGGNWRPPAAGAAVRSGGRVRHAADPQRPRRRARATSSASTRRRSARSSTTRASSRCSRCSSATRASAGTLARALQREPGGDRRDRLPARAHPSGRADARRRRCLRDDFAEALEVADEAGLIFGCEHNAPGHRLLVEPGRGRGAPRCSAGARLRLGHQPHAARAHRALPRAARAVHARARLATRRCPRRTTTCRSAAAPSTSRPLRGIDDVPVDPGDRRPADLRRPGPRHGRGAARLARAASSPGVVTPVRAAAAPAPAPAANASLTTRSTFSRLPFDDRLQAAELEAREADPACRAHDLEAEVGEEVLREDRLVHAEALVARLALRIAIRERLEPTTRRGRAPRRSRRGTATAAPTGSTGRRGTRT